MSRSTILRAVAALVLTAGVTSVLGAAPAAAAVATCAEGAGVLTITLPASANIVDLTYEPSSNGLVVTSDGQQTSCAVGHFTAVTEVAFAADNSASFVRVHVGVPWETPLGDLIPVELAGLGNLHDVVVDAQEVNPGEEAPVAVTVTSSPPGLSLDGGSTPEVALPGVLTALSLYGSGGADVFELSGALTITDEVSVHAGGGDDAVTTEQLGSYFLEQGDDAFTGGAGPEQVYPGDGADVVESGGGGDVLTMEPDEEDDLIDGGGDATLQLHDDDEGVSISDNGVADDGETIFGAEADNYVGLTDVVVEGEGQDLIDMAGIETADGGAGDDLFKAADGDRSVIGGTGADILDLSALGGGVSGSFDGGPDAAQMTPMNPAQGVTTFTSITQVVGTLFADDLIAECATCLVTPGQGDDTVTLFDGATFSASFSPDGKDTVVGNGTASYATRLDPVNVSLDIAPDAPRDDGEPGEKDDIRTANVEGGQANDQLSGDNHSNALLGGAGNDVLYGREGADTIFGGEGDDNANGSAGDDVVRGEDGNDLVRGGDGYDQLYGDEIDQAFADRIDGGQGDDDEFGRGGDDTFLQGGNGFDNGTDVMDGGAGTDTVSYLGRTSGINATVNAVMDDGAPGEGDQIRATIESLTGGNGDDVLQGGAAAGTLLGNGGNDKLDGRGGNDTVRGGDGDDQLLEGTPANGADTYYGDAGSDTITYLGRTSGVTVVKDALANDGGSGGAEGDYVRTDVETVIGTNFADVLTGGGLDDWLYGRGGNDTLTGKAGSDSMYGELGDDTIFAKDNKADTLDGGGGTDSAQYDAIDLRTLIEITLP